MSICGSVGVEEMGLEGRRFRVEEAHCDEDNEAIRTLALSSFLAKVLFQKTKLLSAKTNHSG